MMPCPGAGARLPARPAPAASTRRIIVGPAIGVDETSHSPRPSLFDTVAP
jgi:hypothetical protein